MKLNQSGLGIVQVLIATAMLGALSLGVMQVSKNMSDVNRDAHSSLDVLMLKEEIYSIINDSEECSFSINDGIQFKRSEIDDKETEGRNLELFLARYDSVQKKRVKGEKRFSATDEKFSKYGKIKIKKIKMVLDPGSDYSEGTITDNGYLLVDFEKPDGKDFKFEIRTKVEVVTDNANKSKFTKCVGLNKTQGANERILVIHAQSDTAIPCPDGWIQEREGYSFVLAATDDGRLSTQDLSDPGSCLEKFGATVHVECQPGSCEYISDNDFSSWLLGWGTGTNVTPSKCRVCSKINGVVKVFHSQTTSYPICPEGLNTLWNGFSVLGISHKNHIDASFRLDGTGSCLRDGKNGVPFIECEKHNNCRNNSSDDYTMFLTTKQGNPEQPAKSFANSINDISKCTVCIGVD